MSLFVLAFLKIKTASARFLVHESFGEMASLGFFKDEITEQC